MLESARTFGELTRLIASASDSREVFDAVSRAAATLLGAPPHQEARERA